MGFKLTVLLVMFVFTVFVCKASIRLYNRIINPIIVCVIPFGLSCLMTTQYSSVLGDELDKGLLWLLCGIVIYIAAFSLTAPLRIGSGKRSKKENTNVVYKKNTVEILINALCIMETLSFLISFVTVYKISGSIKAILVKSTWVRWQYLARSTPKPVAILTVFLSINTIVLACLIPKAIQLRCKYIKLKLIYVVSLMLMDSIVTMSKEAFVVDIIMLIYAFSQYSAGIKTEFKMIKRSAIWIVVLMVILLIAVSVQRNYSVVKEYNSYWDMLKGTVNQYVTLPVIGFVLLLRYKDYSYGALCFRPLLNILSYLGFGQRRPVIQEAVEGVTNVFTSFGNMYIDFGVAGILLLSVFFGAFLGAIYSLDNCNKLSKVAINSIVGMNMLFTFYDLQVIQTTYLFAMLYAVLLEIVIGKYLYTSEPNEEGKIVGISKPKIRISKH